VLATTYATWWRRRWRGERPSGSLPDRVDPAGTGPVEDRDALWRALGGLPRRQRAVVVLRYYEDLSEAETAAALGISTGTVKSQSTKALAALRRDATLAGTIGGES
jgi:DNA-directed RNA polymerase specialized sigma24 family protein